MLKTLIISNYALIDALEIEFNAGLNIITGETGAGKSILLGALGLILGSRADVNVLKDKLKPCVVEGVFDISNHNLQQHFIDNDLEFSELVTIRRHINPAGKSRAFVNELPVTLNVLKELVEQIVDIHSQHENLLLADGNFQLNTLDAFADNFARLASYKSEFHKYKQLVAELDELKDASQRAKTDLDYIQFQLKQLDEAKLVSGEEIELEALQKQLSHAGEIKTNLQNVAGYLNDESSSVLLWLRDAQASLGRIADFFAPATEMSKRIESCRLELKDLAHEVEVQNGKIEMDPAHLEMVNQRLDLIFTLQQKHRVASVEELIGIRDGLRVRVDQIANYDQAIEAKANQLNSCKLEAASLAAALSQARVNACKQFESKVKELLSQLGMPYANFSIDIAVQQELRPNGFDRVSFLFSANKQASPQEIGRVASGGELSRLMLSLKSLLVRKKGLPTIILDEIDTGVSGDIADKVGNIIFEMAKGMQVINITHLPQIASKGKHHFMVYKEHGSVSSKTQIRLLSSEERVTEIAKMLSGEKVSEAAITNAKHLLGITIN